MSSSKEHATLVTELDPGDDDEGPCRAAQDSSREAKPSSKGAIGERESRNEANYDHAVVETTGGADLDRFLAVLADIDGARHDGDEPDDEDAPGRDAPRGDAPRRPSDIAWPDTSGLDSEQAIVADVEAALADGLLAPAGPPLPTRETEQSLRAGRPR
jgi:hypothetical protein